MSSFFCVMPNAIKWWQQFILHLRAIRDTWIDCDKLCDRQPPATGQCDRSHYKFSTFAPQPFSYLGEELFVYDVSLCEAVRCTTDFFVRCESTQTHREHHPGPSYTVTYGIFSATKSLCNRWGLWSIVRAVWSCSFVSPLPPRAESARLPNHTLSWHAQLHACCTHNCTRAVLLVCILEPVTIHVVDANICMYYIHINVYAHAWT